MKFAPVAFLSISLVATLAMAHPSDRDSIEHLGVDTVVVLKEPINIAARKTQGELITSGWNRLSDNHCTLNAVKTEDYDRQTPLTLTISEVRPQSEMGRRYSTLIFFKELGESAHLICDWQTTIGQLSRMSPIKEIRLAAPRSF